MMNCNYKLQKIKIADKKLPYTGNGLTNFETNLRIQTKIYAVS